MKYILKLIIFIVNLNRQKLIKVLKTMINYNISVSRENYPKIAILGDGPSLNKKTNIILDLKKKDFTFISMNSGINNPIFWMVKPRFYFLLDYVFYEETAYTEDVIEKYQTFSKINWNMTLVVNKVANKKGGLLKKIENKFIQIEYVDFDDNIGRHSKRFMEYDLGLSSPRIQNVFIGAIFYCFRLNVEKIICFGLDLSMFREFIVDKSNFIIESSNHASYQYVEPRFNDYKIQKHENDITVSKQLFKFVLMFRGFEELNLYANYRKIKIFNANPDSFVDCFEKLVEEEDFERV